ncbi:MAG: hypothetical protein ACLUE1_02545 [Adlercreutzia equolifaciens]
MREILRRGSGEERLGVRLVLGVSNVSWPAGAPLVTARSSLLPSGPA